MESEWLENLEVPASFDEPAPSSAAGGANAPPSAEEIKSWLVIYPCYFNENITVQKGRRLSKDLLKGCGHVDIHDVIEACVTLYRSLGLVNPKIVADNKKHPRHPFQTGRMRVQLADSNGNLLHPEISSKHVLLQRLAALIPTLPGRTVRAAQREQYMQAHKERIDKMRQEAAKNQPKKAGKKGGR